MIVDLLSLKINTPARSTPPGRGFYQREEDALYVQAGGFISRKFFSELGAKYVRFELDLTGCLISIEVTLPRRRWQVQTDLVAPVIAEPADVRWLDFRSQIEEPEFITDEDRSSLLLRFVRSDSQRWYTLADSIMVQVDDNDNLMSLLITGIVEDLAGQQISAFRGLIDRTLEEDVTAN